jgi:hypothetical protein
MDISRLYDLIESQRSDREDLLDLREIVDQYPYFQAGIFAYLDCLFQYDNGKFREELSRLSIFVCDRKALFYYVLRDDYRYFFEKTGKGQLSKDRTDILLNAFFESNDVGLDNNTLEYELPSVGLVSTDYLAFMNDADNTVSAQNDSPVRFKHQELIDSYIEKSEKEGIEKMELDDSESVESQEQLPVEDSDEELTDEMFFTETLAKIYIKQRKYEKAYKIIKHLSLNYPKKNIYFADQLSFLEKLIINSKYKDRK